MWDLISLTRDQTSFPTLGGKVSTTVVPGKSCLSFKKKKKWLRLQWPNHSRFLGIWVASHNVTPKLIIIFIFILFPNIYFWWWVSYTTVKACFVGKFAHYPAGLTTLPTLVKREFTGFFKGMLTTTQPLWRAYAFPSRCKWNIILDMDLYSLPTFHPYLIMDAREDWPLYSLVFFFFFKLTFIGE